VAAGEFDAAVVNAYAYAATPAVVAVLEGILYRQDIRTDPAGFGVYHISVPYGPRKYETGSFRFSFDTTGGTIHIKASKQTVAKYPPTAPDHKQLIGVHGDEVDGADVVIPALKISVHFKHPMAVVTIPFAKQLARYTGKSNSDFFLTCNPGEVLFLGATGSDGTDCEAEVNYQFAFSENLQNQVIGAISGINKDGWDVAWIAYKDAVDGNKPVKQPEFIYVERVYDRIPMALALGFG
jgi:hypothetical protein